MNRLGMLWLVTPPKEIVDPSFEVIFKDEFIGNHVEDTPNELCDNDKFVRSKNERESRRRLRKVMNKSERMKAKLTKKLTSLICPLKRTHWNNGKQARENRPRKI